MPVDLRAFRERVVRAIAKVVRGSPADSADGIRPKISLDDSRKPPPRRGEHRELLTASRAGLRAIFAVYRLSRALLDWLDFRRCVSQIAAATVFRRQTIRI
jgi:hypothetical protein